MKLLDANLLIYAHNADASEHGPARHWVESVVSGSEPVGIAWITILAVLRLLSDARLFAHPRSMTDLIAIVSSWTKRPNVIIVEPTERHWIVLSELLVKARAQGRHVSDAHLAALAIEHGATLCTTDRDFARFPGLKWMNPLEP